MALIKCPECGKEISDKATNCPSCGHPLSGQINQNLMFRPKEEEVKNSTGKNIFIGASLVFFLMCLLFFVYTFLFSQESKPEEAAYRQSADNILDENSNSASSAPSNETAGQRNAVKSAKSYLNYSPFSRDGLIEQLEYEGYTHEEAVYGAEANDF